MMTMILMKMMMVVVVEVVVIMMMMMMKITMMFVVVVVPVLILTMATTSTTMVLVMIMMLMLVLTMKTVMLLIIMAIMMIMLLLRNDQYVTSVGAVLLPNRVRNPKGHPTYRISKINLEGSRFQSLMGTCPLFPYPCLWGTDIFIFSLTYTDFLIFPRGRDSTQQT